MTALRMMFQRAILALGRTVGVAIEGTRAAASLRRSAVRLRIPDASFLLHSRNRELPVNAPPRDRTHARHFPERQITVNVARVEQHASQAAGRAFISRITARTDDRDIPVSDQTIAAYRAAARGWASAPADQFGYLDGIAQPALVVNGSSDIVIPTINSYHLYQHLPDAELMLLPDSGHGAHFQYVDRFVRRVIDFLDIQPHETGAGSTTVEDA
jgi:pimeloyl-ACP methyl ester carboxylesterase